MRPNLVVLLVVLVVGLGLAWLLLGGALDDSTDPSGLGRGDGEEGGGPLTSRDEGEAVVGGGPRLVDRGPILFGRSRDQRVGRGALVGRVANVEDGAPVAGVRLILVGTGFSDEEVTLRVASAEDGSFRYTEVPAGDDYSLKIEADALPGRTLPGVAVRDGSATQLGTIWLGAKAAFAGRVVDADGRGVAAADVKIHLGHLSLLDMIGNLAELISSLDRDPEPLDATISDRDGSFRFAALDPGHITVTVRAPGFAPVYVAAVVTPEGTSARPLVVRLCEGTVVAGKVVDGTGRGIGGARVAILAEDDPEAFLYGRSFTDTLDDGSFRVDTAGTGKDIKLLAAAFGYPLTMHSAKPGDEDVRIVLEHGATLVVRILEEPDDVPVEAAQVFLTISESGELTSDPQTLVSGRTDRMGTATFEVRPGRIQMVMAMHPGGSSGMWAGEALGLPGSMKGPENGTVKAGRQEMTFRMSEALLVHGKVTGPDGEPVAGARVFALAGFQFGKPAVTDEAGAYRLRVGAGSALIVFVRAEGYVQNEPSTVKPPTSSEARTITHDIVLERAGVVTGRVVDAKGLPVAGAQVRAQGDSQGMGVFPALLSDTSGITGREGRYVLDGVGPGDEVRVVARHPDFVDAASPPFAVESGGSIRAKDVILKGGLVLEIHVADPRGAPLPGARVELKYQRADEIVWDFMEGMRSSASLRTDRGGRARQERVPPGVVTITASHPDFAAGISEVEVGEGDTSPVRVEVELSEPMVIAGRVVDEAGKAVKGAFVNVNSVAVPAITRMETTNADGAFRIGNLPVGAADVHVMATGYRGYQAAVSEGTESLLVRLEAEDPESQARRAELRARMNEVAGRLASASNDEERDAITKEMQAIGIELAGLQGESDPDPVPVEIVERTEIEEEILDEAPEDAK